LYFDKGKKEEKIFCHESLGQTNENVLTVAVYISYGWNQWYTKSWHIKKIFKNRLVEKKWNYQNYICNQLNQFYISVSSMYGPKTPVTLLFPGPGFCQSKTILLLAAKIPAKAKKVVNKTEQKNPKKTLGELNHFSFLYEDNSQMKNRGCFVTNL
jgi:hypothetical protein